MKSSKSEGQIPFWRAKTLEELSPQEWESLCDGCGRCCLNKLEDWDTGEIHWTNVACTLLDGSTCRCKNYERRFDFVSDCVQLDPKTVRELKWLPVTCAYRLVREGKDLHWWHPLVSGDPRSVHQAGISVQDKTVPEDGLEPEDLEDYLVAWPDEPEQEAEPQTSQA
ncbi:YcgN family cysteine cluster protein [Polycladidibacter hongkongensis]|uniref:YcgN family cysteine cluster protein n=1 Tax=Polycladidibacter hongkongensis TaxID=1647556 RepID=UPI00082A98DA|nr:YcgN family cysteine cluster protein [Pseudovibrio hongkongensis]